MDWRLKNSASQRTTKNRLVKKDLSVRYKKAGKKRICEEALYIRRGLSWDSAMTSTIRWTWWREQCLF